MFSATALFPNEGEKWDDDYIQLIYRTIIWFRVLPPDVNSKPYEHLPPLNVHELDDELFSLIENLIFQESLDGHIRVFRTMSSPKYSCWILPTQTNLTVWNNVEGSRATS